MLEPLMMLEGSWPDEPGLDTAISQLILDNVSAGELPPTMRLYVPGREVAFGKQDTVTSQYPAAVSAARAAGFNAVQRLAGGRAAVFTEETIAFSLALPDPDPRSTIYERFDHITEMIVATFARLGVASGVGEIPGEYCPGEYSVHHERRIKLMGVGQRLAKHAAHIGGVIVVDRTDLLLSALVPVYEALELEWEPATAGALGDVRPGISGDEVIAAFESVLSDRYAVGHDSVADHLVQSARCRAADYLPKD